MVEEEFFRCIWFFKYFFYIVYWYSKFSSIVKVVYVFLVEYFVGKESFEKEVFRILIDFYIGNVIF